MCLFSFFAQEQLESVEEEHKKILEMLQMQLDMTQGENTRLQREVNNLQRSLRSKDVAAAEERRSPPGFFPVMTHPEGERQEGEVCSVLLWFSFVAPSFVLFMFLCIFILWHVLNSIAKVLFSLFTFISRFFCLLASLVHYFSGPMSEV